ncbi:hypothetical protein B0H34DRAFT_734860 [Crassisporium funariophilum]|nr:hypothetical protein B0H34DRAFT_734860 [Crassisporium funariophilum]
MSELLSPRTGISISAVRVNCTSATIPFGLQSIFDFIHTQRRYYITPTMVLTNHFLRLVAVGLLATQSAFAASVHGSSTADDLANFSKRRTSSLPEMQNLQSRLPDVGRCWKNYCWAWCTDPAVRFWCYTTRGSTFDGNYVGCTAPYECEGVIKCAGPCGL